MKGKYAVECGSQTSWKEHNPFAPLRRPFFPISLLPYPSVMFLPLSSMPVSLDTLSSPLSLQVDKVIDQVKAFTSVSNCEADVELSKTNFLRKKKESQQALSWEVGQGEYMKNN